MNIPSVDYLLDTMVLHRHDWQSLGKTPVMFSNNQAGWAWQCLDYKTKQKLDKKDLQKRGFKTRKDAALYVEVNTNISILAHGFCRTKNRANFYGWQQYYFVLQKNIGGWQVNHVKFGIPTFEDKILNFKTRRLALEYLVEYCPQFFNQKPIKHTFDEA